MFIVSKCFFSNGLRPSNVNACRSSDVCTDIVAIFLHFAELMIYVYQFNLCDLETSIKMININHTVHSKNGSFVEDNESNNG